MGIPSVISYLDAFEGDNEWAALSNFWQGAPIHFNKYAFATGEHMFQAFKARNTHDFRKVVACPTPAEAKQQGKHMLRLRPDWERVKYDVMRLVLAYKFALGRDETTVLLRTEDALIVEGTTWGDRVWGVDLKAGRKRLDAHARATNTRIDESATWEPGEPWNVSPGRNWLGVLLMARRAELRAELATGHAFSYDEVFAFSRWVPPNAPS